MTNKLFRIYSVKTEFRPTHCLHERLSLVNLSNYSLVILSGRRPELVEGVEGWLIVRRKSAGFLTLGFGDYFGLFALGKSLFCDNNFSNVRR